MNEKSPQSLVGYRRTERRTFLPGGVEVEVTWEYVGEFERAEDSGPEATVLSAPRSRMSASPTTQAV